MKLANVIIGVGALAGVWLNVSQPLGDAAMPPALSSYGPRPSVVAVPASIAIAKEGGNG